MVNSMGRNDCIADHYKWRSEEKNIFNTDAARFSILELRLR